MMIKCRQVEISDRRSNCTLERWNVEFYVELQDGNGGTGVHDVFPVGTAYVTVRMNLDGTADAFAHHVLVDDRHRGQGIATELLAACRARWNTAEPTDGVGAALWWRTAQPI